MIGWRLGILIVGLIFALPFLLLNNWAMQTSKWAVEMSAAAESQSAGEIKTLKLGEVAESSQTRPSLPRSPIAWLQDRGDLRRAFSGEELTASRSVSLSFHLPFAAFLREGEAPPEQMLRPLYAKARAPQMASQYCEELLLTLASSCKVYETRTSQSSRDPRIKLSLRLVYTPSYPLGAPTYTAGANLISTRVDLLPETEASALPVYDATQRQFQLMRAQAICEQIRAEFGSCIVSGVNLDEVADRNGGTPRMRVRATFHTYALDTTEETQRLEDMAKGLAAQKI